MIKHIKSLVLLFVFLFNSNLFAHTTIKSDVFVLNRNMSNYEVDNFVSTYFKYNSESIFRISLATPPPTVSTPIYYCQNSVATPLTATPSGGGVLNWYTVPVLGISSPISPTPSTTTVGSTTYYVSQSITGVESTRVTVVVNVVADNGAVLLNFKCDPTQILPADKNSSVFFDWSNNPLISNTYNVSYSIQGGPVITGTTGTSHWQIFGMLPGQSATLTLTSATHPCVPAQTIICSVPCGATTTPNFPLIAPFCTGAPAPILGPTSPNGITGTWSPAIISNTANGNYVFTPNPILFPCALTQTLTVIVTPLATPTFSTIPSIVCQGASAPVLPLISSNVIPIIGTWSPAIVDTSILGNVIYTFTPSLGQCTSVTLTTAAIKIDPVITPNFAIIPPLCSGKVAPVLTNTSPNGIVGAWLPAIISNTISGNYVFTPSPNQCATTQTLNVLITPKTVTNFPVIPAFCSGTTAPILATTSPNGITGTWLPPIISNTVSGSYVFTPNSTECATNQTLSVIVNPLIAPNFTNLSICSGSTSPILATTSPNGISGTWVPATIDNTTSRQYVFTPNAPQCASQKTISVTVNPSNTLVSVNWSVTEAFSKNQIVTVTATAAGNYLYQLDSGPLQTNPIFENVALGMHSITVSDVNGCSLPIVINDVNVINYPKYFTPNSDGYNDTWNIFSLADQSASRIVIFDRFGKFLKEIRPGGNGWDGTYIGQPMPANDYWFSVEYLEQSVSKKYNSHFSLKR